MMTIKGINIVADVYCPTWSATEPLPGWRMFLHLRLRMPAHWFKQTKPERVMYEVTTAPGKTMVVCSPETRAWLEARLDVKEPA